MVGMLGCGCCETPQTCGCGRSPFDIHWPTNVPPQYQTNTLTASVSGPGSTATAYWGGIPYGDVRITWTVRQLQVAISFGSQSANFQTSATMLAYASCDIAVFNPSDLSTYLDMIRVFGEVRSGSVLLFANSSLLYSGSPTQIGGNILRASQLIGQYDFTLSPVIDSSADPCVVDYWSVSATTPVGSFSFQIDSYPRTNLTRRRVPELCAGVLGGANFNISTPSGTIVDFGPVQLTASAV